MTDQTLLHRQIHPSWVQNFTVSSQAFKEGVMAVNSPSFTPMPKDEGQLSVYNGDKWNPKEAFDHYVNELKYQSCGVLAVSKAECDQVSPLSVVENNDPFDGHAYINFNDVQGKSNLRRTAIKLRDMATDRGWQHTPDN